MFWTRSVTLLGYVGRIGLRDGLSGAPHDGGTIPIRTFYLHKSSSRFYVPSFCRCYIGEFAIAIETILSTILDCRLVVACHKIEWFEREPI
jgi:hypothetical protein